MHTRIMSLWLTLSEATLLGETVQEVTQLNIESLWSGGPFQDPVCLTNAVTAILS